MYQSVATITSGGVTMKPRLQSAICRHKSCQERNEIIIKYPIQLVQIVCRGKELRHNYACSVQGYIQSSTVYIKRLPQQTKLFVYIEWWPNTKGNFKLCFFLRSCIQLTLYHLHFFPLCYFCGFIVLIQEHISALSCASYLRRVESSGGFLHQFSLWRHFVVSRQNWRGAFRVHENWLCNSYKKKIQNFH